MRGVAIIAVWVTSACSAEPPPSDEAHCAMQTDCGAAASCSLDYKAVCEDTICTSLGRAEAQDFFLNLRSVLSSLQGSGAYRTWVLYPVTPKGENVTCDKDARRPAIAGTATVENAVLSDPARVNIAAFVQEFRFSLGINDVVQTGLFLTAPGSVVYTEIYTKPVSQCAKPEGLLVGHACIENAPFTPGTSSRIAMTILP